MSASDVVDFADHVLNTVIETFAQEGVSLPDLQMLTIGGQGSTVHLCEQLSISVEELYSGTPADQGMIPVRCDAPRSVNIAVELVRKAPTGTAKGRSTPLAPSVDAAQQTAIARERMVDMDLLMTSALDSFHNQWYGSGIAHVSAAPPDGGFQAIVLSLTTAVGGM